MKMRKVILLLCSILLVACQGQQENKIQDNSMTNEPNEKEELVLKEWKYLMYQGDGNDNGYYRLVNDDDGRTNILYTDYSTEKEVYLCNKPECQHKDKSCTSYVENDIEEMFVYQDHLYLIESVPTNFFAIGDDGNSVSNVSRNACIYQMDLDGQNKKEIYQLAEGYAFEAANLALTGDQLYLPITKSEQIEMEKNTQTSVLTKNELYKIDLKTGEGQKVMDLYDGLSDKTIMSVDGRNIVLSGQYYEEDPRQYLEKKDYKGYDQVLMNSKVLYETVNVDTLDKKVLKPEGEIGGEYYKGKIYFTDNKSIYTYDLKTEKQEKMVSLPQGYTYNLDFVQDKIIVAQWKNDQFQKTYYTDIENPDLKELDQYKRSPKESVEILSIGSKNIYAIYDREGKDEKTWAGTMQYETHKQYRGLISLDDFFNNQKDYKTMKLIYEGE